MQQLKIDLAYIHEIANGMSRTFNYYSTMLEHHWDQSQWKQWGEDASLLLLHYNQDRWICFLGEHPCR